MTELERFLEKKHLPGRLIFGKTWGSRSHNTNHETSDWDFSGVYQVPTREFLGMNKVTENVCSVEGQEKPDYAFYEAGKFCELLLVGNPGILEMLFTDRMSIETPEWTQLKKQRQKFLSKNAVRQYVGYAEGQLKRLKAKKGLHTTGGTYNEKWAYHLMCLLIDADRIVVGCEPVVWKDEGPERNYLMSIRKDELSQDEIMDDAARRVDKLRDALEKTNLPETGNKDILEGWLIDLRLENL